MGVLCSLSCLCFGSLLAAVKFFFGEMLLLLLLVVATSDHKKVKQRASESKNVVGKIIWRLVWPSLTRDVGDEWEEDEEKY